MTQQALLVVDDDVTFRSRLLRAFRDRGLAVGGASSHGEALQVAAQLRPQFAVVDLRMPGRSGLETVQALRELDDELRVVVLTGYGSIATALAAVRHGAVDYLTKPADADQILAALGRLEDEPQPAQEPPPSQGDSTPTLERVEWEHIQRVLADCEGNVSHTARVLGIHRRTLQRKLANHPPPR